MARRAQNNMGPARELKNIVERIVAADIELKQTTADLKEEIEAIYEEAEDKGFDKKALKIAVRRRHESAEQRAKRHEIEQLADVYSAAIGDLYGKPLDDLTRRRLDEMRQQQLQQGEPPKEPSPQAEMPQEATQPAEPPETAEQAKDKGKQARRDNLRIVDNPYHSSSPLRAAWDEGWCEEDGSDGMEVPAAWKRTKPEEEKPDGEGGSDDDDKKPPPPPPNGGGDDARPQV